MLGPHFAYDLIRLARRGWPTWLRALYLLVLLSSLALMYQSQGGPVGHHRLAGQAEQANYFALTIILLQDVVLLLLLPVYVAGAIVEEKEKGTIEALFLTHLTDREMALGKLGARLMPLAALVVAGLPLLAFLYLAGNVPLGMLVYHEANALLLLLAGGGVCLYFSTQSDTAFQAITNSYPSQLALGLIGVLGAALGPWLIGVVMAELQMWFFRTPVQPEPWYGVCALLLVPFYLLLTIAMLDAALRSMRHFRLAERRRPRRLTGALSLTDDRAEAPVQRRHRARSRIHPLARAVRDRALFWKECLKDGTGWSLTGRWALTGAGLVAAASLAYRLAELGCAPADLRQLRGMAAAFPYTAYFVALGAYALLVTFQTTMSVAGEKEQVTLDFLLLIPDERRAILLYKWLGPFWRNWPVLAIAYLGVLLGLGCGLYSARAALMMLLLPWPLLLMLSAVALGLSVTCRRVLFANLMLMAGVAVLVVAHVAASAWMGNVLVHYLALLFETTFAEFTRVPWEQAFVLALGEQVVFLLIAATGAAVAYRRFRRLG